MSKFNLNIHTARLLQNEPFFAALSRCVTKTVSTVIPTAAVSFDKETQQFKMKYNPNFLSRLTDIEVLGVLKHEFYHLIFEHVTTRLPDGNLTKSIYKTWNYATDLAINSHLKGEIPSNCLMPGEGDYEGWPLAECAEYYFERMKKDGIPGGGEGEGEDQGGGEGEDQGGGQGQFDSHEGWNQKSGSDDSLEDVAKERLKEILKKAAQSAHENGWGSVSSACQKDIMNLLECRVDWRKMLRYFVRTSQRANKRSTPRRINKRYPYIHPGKRVKRVADIAICMDQSGSVSDELLTLFFAELNKLAAFATFTVIPHDSHVDEGKIFVWKKGQTVLPTRVLCGGTNFNPPTDYINKKRFDGAIFLTDLEAPKPKACKTQRMWMTDAEHADSPNFVTKERVIVINSK